MKFAIALSLVLRLLCRGSRGKAPVSKLVWEVRSEDAIARIVLGFWER